MRVLLTGATTGLGETLCGQLQDKGYEVTRFGRSGPDLCADFSTWYKRLDDAEFIINELFNRFGPFDHLVNNAGDIRVAMTKEHTARDFMEVISINLFAAFMITKEFIIRNEHRHSSKPVLHGDFYRVINIQSMGSKRAGRGCHGYCASKAGLAMLTKVFAREWTGKAPFLFFGVNPDIFSSPASDRLMQQVADTRGWTLENAEKYSNYTPLKRPITCEEVCDVVKFLLEAAPEACTGASFDIPSGMGQY